MDGIRPHMLGSPRRVRGWVGLLASLSLLWIGCSSKVVPGPDSTASEDLADPIPAPVDLSFPVNDLAQPPSDLKMPEDLGKPVGSSCTTDGDCLSGACRKVGTSGSLLCVGTCKTQRDCDSLPGQVTCQPERVGDAQGLCVPPSASHCASCDKDADCGTMTERCLQAPGDVAPACHLDCSLSDSVCPSDYECQAITDGAVARKLCVPKTKLCLDSLGGYCDRVALPQSCARKNTAGQCIGQRACLTGGRYDRCAASVPQFKRCGDMDPPGCTLALASDAIGTKQNCARCGNACGSEEDCCAGSCKKLNTATDCGACGKSCAMGSGCCAGSCTQLDTVSNCGACGTVCPGMGQPTSDVFCDASKLPASCGMTCRGDNYDVDVSAANGCEVLDVTPPGHTQSTASSRGSRDCFDTASRDSFSSAVPSDLREHKNPPVVGFSGMVGAAPDYWVVRATGGTFCQNDYEVTITTTGGSAMMTCYRLTIITNKRTDTLDVSGAGSKNMSTGTGAYSGGSDIYFVVEKTCTTAMPEKVSYSVEYHL